MKRKVELVQDSATGLETSNGINVAEVTGAVVDNSIARFDGTSGQVQNSGVFIDDNGNVGIGTSSPLYKVDVVGDIRVKSTTAFAGIALESSASSFSYINMGDSDDLNIGQIAYSNTDNSMTFTTNNTERVKIDLSGNVGVGVTPSAWHSSYKVLDIGAVGSLGVQTDNGLLLSNNMYYDGTNSKYKQTDEASYYFQQNGTHTWGVAPSGTAGNTITFTTAMTLKNNGNLLVGTTTDNGVDKLQVNGSINVGVIKQYNKVSSYTGITLAYNIASKYIQIKTNCASGNAAHIKISGFCYTPAHLMNIDCAGYADSAFTITRNIVKDLNGNGVTGTWYRSSDNKLCLELVATANDGFSGSLLNIDLQRTLYSPATLDIVSYTASNTQTRY